MPAVSAEAPEGPVSLLAGAESPSSPPVGANTHHAGPPRRRLGLHRSFPAPGEHGEQRRRSSVVRSLNGGEHIEHRERDDRTGCPDAATIPDRPGTQCCRPSPDGLGHAPVDMRRMHIYACFAYLPFYPLTYPMCSRCSRVPLIFHAILSIVYIGTRKAVTLSACVPRHT